MARDPVRVALSQLVYHSQYLLALTGKGTNSVNIQIRPDQPVLSLVTAYTLDDGDIPDGLGA
jgi:hypothetical protein